MKDSRVFSCLESVYSACEEQEERRVGVEGQHLLQQQARRFHSRTARACLPPPPAAAVDVVGAVHAEERAHYCVVPQQTQPANQRKTMDKQPTTAKQWINSQPKQWIKS